MPTFLTSLSQLIFEQKKLQNFFMLRDGASITMFFEQYNIHKVRSIGLYRGNLGIEEIFADFYSKVEKFLTPFSIFFSFDEFFQSLFLLVFFLVKNQNNFR